MNIVQVIDQLGLGGAERVCVNLINLLHKNGIAVKLILLKGGGPLIGQIDKGIEIIQLKEQKSKLKAYKEFKKHIKSNDIIHAHVRANYRFVKKASLIFRIKNKIIFHDHYGKIEVDKSITLFYKIFKPNAYIGVSKLLTNWAIFKMKMPAKQVFLINNLVFKNEQQHLNKIRSGIVFIGNLKKVKNHIFAVKIAEALKMDLTIYCIENKNSEYFKNLIDEIENNSNVNVNFVYNQPNIQQDLHKFQFALCTSVSESGPLVLLEFLSQGLPFLTYHTGNIADFVQKELPDFVMDNFEVNRWVERTEIISKYDKEQLIKVFDTYWENENFIEKYKNIYNYLA